MRFILNERSDVIFFKYLRALICGGLGFSFLLLQPAYAVESKDDLSNDEVVAKLVSIDNDNFKKMVTYTGPILSMDGAKDRKDWKGKSEIGLVALLLNKHELTNQNIYNIIVDMSYLGAWRNYETAYDSEGNIFSVQLDRRLVDSSSKLYPLRTETVLLSVTRQYLEAHQDTGVRFQVRNRGERPVKDIYGNYVNLYFEGFLPGGYIKGFLSAVR